MMNSVLYASALLAAFKGVQAGINLNSAQNIAVYWGKYLTGSKDDRLLLTRKTFKAKTPLTWLKQVVVKKG